MESVMKTPSTVAEIAQLLDHTILKPAATREDVLRVTREGKELKVASVCVNPFWASEVSDCLLGSGVKTCCVAGFPLGASLPQVIAEEAARAVSSGAAEIDMVMNLGLAKAGKWDAVATGIATVKNAIPGTCLKVILEICELTDEEIRLASQAALDGGAQFIKTSTGFGKSGATVDAVKIMAGIASGKSGVKAAGGIKGLDDVLAMVDAGATRIGASASITILKEAEEKFGE